MRWVNSLNLEHSLAVSVQANKGVFALLLGSGISSNAGIKTGWGIINDLCNQLMILEKEELHVNDSPVEWYGKKYGDDPTYSGLLEQLAKSPSERNGLLEKYFIPSEIEKENGEKIPTKAHRAIASLVKKGYIRVIITTNFDRLIEQSLDDEGVNYQTIYDEHAIKGSKPLAHVECTVIKVHGDYKDTRFKNIADELSKYSKGLNQLLERIFDEYGLIVSGWSAEWDPALIESVKSVKSRRYSWYWTSINKKIGNAAKELINFRDAEVIVDPHGADSFFSNLLYNVEALESFRLRETISYEMLLAKVKKMIFTNNDMDLQDLISYEIKKIRNFINKIDVNDKNLFNQENIMRLLHQYIEVSYNLSGVMATIGFFGKSEFHKRVIVQTLERLTEIGVRDGFIELVEIEALPVILTLYSVGIAIVFKEDYRLLNHVITKPNARGNKNTTAKNPFLYLSSPARIRDILKRTTNYNRKILPGNEFIFENVETCINHLIISKEEYDIYFAIFEFLLSLKQIQEGNKTLGLGRFGIKDSSEIKKFISDGKSKGEGWEVLELFDHSSEDLLNILKSLDENLSTPDFYKGYANFYTEKEENVADNYNFYN